MVSMKFFVVAAILGLAMVAQPSLQQGYGGKIDIVLSASFIGKNTKAFQAALKLVLEALFGVAEADITITPPPVSPVSIICCTVSCMYI